MRHNLSEDEETQRLKSLAHQYTSVMKSIEEALLKSDSSVNVEITPQQFSSKITLKSYDEQKLEEAIFAYVSASFPSEICGKSSLLAKTLDFHGSKYNAEKSENGNFTVLEKKNI